MTSTATLASHNALTYWRMLLSGNERLFCPATLAGILCHGGSRIARNPGKVAELSVRPLTAPLFFSVQLRYRVKLAVAQRASLSSATHSCSRLFPGHPPSVSSSACRKQSRPPSNFLKQAQFLRQSATHSRQSFNPPRILCTRAPIPERYTAFNDFAASERSLRKPIGRTTLINQDVFRAVRPVHPQRPGAGELEDTADPSGGFDLSFD